MAQQKRHSKRDQITDGDVFSSVHDDDEDEDEDEDEEKEEEEDGEDGDVAVVPLPSALGPTN